MQFVRGEAETISVDLFYDSTEDGTGPSAKSIIEKTDQMYQLVKVLPHTARAADLHPDVGHELSRIQSLQAAGEQPASRLPVRGGERPAQVHALQSPG